MQDLRYKYYNSHLNPYPDGIKLLKNTISWQEINLWQRLMGGVRKRLKLVYVEIPVPEERDWRDVNSKEDFEKVLMRYKIREVMNFRVMIARERDKYNTWIEE